MSSDAIRVSEKKKEMTKYSNVRLIKLPKDDDNDDDGERTSQTREESHSTLLKSHCVKKGIGNIIDGWMISE